MLIFHLIIRDAAGISRQPNPRLADDCDLGVQIFAGLHKKRPLTTCEQESFKRCESGTSHGPKIFGFLLACSIFQLQGDAAASLDSPISWATTVTLGDQIFADLHKEAIPGEVARESNLCMPFLYNLYIDSRYGSIFD